MSYISLELNDLWFKGFLFNAAFISNYSLFWLFKLVAIVLFAAFYFYEL